MTLSAHRPRARKGQGELLHTEVLSAARELLRRTGDESQVTMRAVAQQVGVSVPSVYLHFADKEALLDAVCTAVFEDLGRSMDAAAVRAATPLEGLHRRGVAYATAALAHPEEYRFLFLRRPSDIGPTTEDLVATEAFGHLVSAVQECLDDGTFQSGESVDLALRLWAGVHGAVSLLITKPAFPWPPAERFIDDVVTMAGLGVAASCQVNQ